MIPSFSTPSPFRRLPARLLVLLAALLLGVANTASAMQIFVKLPDGRPLALEVEANNSVRDVKTWIEFLVSVPVPEQVLLFDGNVLEDDRTLSDYNIQKESTLELRMPALEAEIARLQRLYAKAKALERGIFISVKSIERARTPAAFNRAKARLRSQMRELTSILAATGTTPSEVANARRQFSRLLAQLKFKKAETRPKRPLKLMPGGPMQVNRLISY